MATVLTFSNQKGGVGKTTSVVNLAAFAALAGHRILVIDSDPQGNASSVLAPKGDFGSLYSGQAPIPTRIEGLDLIPSGTDLIDQEKRLVLRDGGRGVLASHVRRLESNYRFIFIDCPPSLGLLTLNALIASTQVIVPFQCEYFAMEGLGQLVAAVQDIQAESNANLSLGAVLLTMYDETQPLSKQIADELRRHFPDQVLAATIPRDIALAAAPSHAKTILEYDPLCPGGIAYLAATQELLHGLR